jgi:hypothetical protein
MAIDLMAYGEARSQAQQVQRESKLNNLQADVEITAAEADRKTALADAIASSRASAAGRGGSAFEGSPLAAVREMSRRSGIEGARNRYSARTGMLAEQYRSAVQVGQIKQQAKISLLKSLESKAAAVATGGAAPVSQAKPASSSGKYTAAPGSIK